MHSWRRSRHTEHQTNIKKFLDHHRDSLKRLKALKLGLEKSSAKEVKQFYTTHSFEVYYVVYNCFSNLEMCIQDKLSKGKGYSEVHSRELLELILPQFRQIFISLPELIHKRWHFNSICLILRKLLHPKNHMKLRFYGMQLLLLWVEALQENAGDSCMELFASAVPHFPPQKTPMGLPLSASAAASSATSTTMGGLERYGVYSSACPSPESLAGWERMESQYQHNSPISSSSLVLSSMGQQTCREVVHPILLIPMLPCPPDVPQLSLPPHPPCSATEELMMCLLESLSKPAHWLHWDDPRQSLRGFAHLFFLFKLFYLACLYKDFQRDAGLYNTPSPPTLDLSLGNASLPSPPPSPSSSNGLQSLQEEPAQNRQSNRHDLAVNSAALVHTVTFRKSKRNNPYRMSSVIKLEYDLSNPIYLKVKNLILTYILRWFLPSSQHRKDAVMTSLFFPPPPMFLPPQELQGPSGAELMRAMWFTSRDNVSLLLEICRQGLSSSTRCIQSSILRQLVDLYRTWYQVPDSPPFMQSPPVQTMAQFSSSFPRDIDLGRLSPSFPEGSMPRVLPWEQLSRYKGFKVVGVEAGLNASICMIVSHTQQVFELNAGTDTATQADLCRKVIRLYQDMVLGSALDTMSWDLLLSVLLKNTWSVLTRKDSNLALSLATPLLQTLLICFLRASGTVEVRQELWDNLLLVLHSLTHWKEVVLQWKVAMMLMTEVLAQAVYRLNLNKLPLDHLASTPHRHRSSSMGREGISSKSPQQDFLLPHIPSFSNISSLYLLPHHTQWKTGAGASSTPKTADSSSQCGNGPGSLLLSQHSAKDHSPHLLTQLSSTPSVLASIEEQVLEQAKGNGMERRERDKLVEASRKWEVVVTPPQIVSDIEEEEEALIDDHKAYEGDVDKISPGTSHESLESSCVDIPDEPLLGIKGHGETRKSLLSATTSLFKQSRKSKVGRELHMTGGGRYGSSSYSPLPGYEDDEEFVGRVRKKNIAHKRSGSDTTTLSVVARDDTCKSSLVKCLVRPQEEAGEQVGPGVRHGTVVSTPTDEKKEWRKPFYMYKSSSDGNIHRLSFPLHSPANDFVGHQDQPFFRVTTTVSPVMTSDSSSLQDIPSLDTSLTAATNTHAATLTSTCGLRFQRSMLINSPEPTDEITCLNGHTFPATPMSPTLLGGTSSTGWRSEVAAITWLRMLKILGNVNEIKDLRIHAMALTALSDIWSTLSNIRANSGISVNAEDLTPPLPHFMPPCELLLPWVVQACSPSPSSPSSCSSSTSRLQGRRIAYQLLCKMTITHWHTPPSHSHLTHFYRLLHLALHSDSDMSAIAIRYGCHLFSYGLAGSSVLLLDFVVACDSILSSQDSSAPRQEALYLLGSLINLPHHTFSLLPSLRDSTDRELRAEELKERVTGIVFRAALKEPSRISRCLALYQVGIIVFSALLTKTPFKKMSEGLDILLYSLKFLDRSVSMCAIDMMSLLSQVGPNMMTLYPTIPSRIIHAICYTIAALLTDELERATWLDKIVVTLIFLLRDWLMVLPLATSSSSSTSSTSSTTSSPPPSPWQSIPPDTIRTVFGVLQAAVWRQELMPAEPLIINNPVSLDLEVEQLETSAISGVLGFRPRTVPANTTIPPPSRRGDIKLSWDALRKSANHFKDGRIQTAARSVMTHLLNLLGHFPFGCGAAQLCSTVKEFHDCPSLSHLNDLSPEMFDSPRIQFFAFGDAAVVTLVEIPTKMEGIPAEVSAGQYQTRVIVRDVTGKYTWDSALLYGPDRCTYQEESCSLATADSLDSLVESVEANSNSPALLEPWGMSQGYPSWRTHVNSDRDVLQDLLKHVEQTSPECMVDENGCGLQKVLEQGVPVEKRLLQLISQQDASESKYNLETISQPCMLGEKTHTPHHYLHTMTFHHCRVFLSHLGLLSWDKRNHLNCLDKTNQLILELKNLDQLQAQSRATYKVAVLYVAPGQEDKASILNNSGGSHCYEDFVAGLGWEVDMETHAGYMAGMQKEFARSCSMPYYATSSEEVLFHVATRMTYKLEQKVRHLGNDEVHIVWSEHWRDYRRSIFRTQFADVLIVLYPLPNGLLRVQINKKPSVPQFGPLFTGAVVNRDTVASLVRATAINALRAHGTKNPLISYRGRYEERLRYILDITNNKVMSSYEEFCENVMHPLEMGSSQSLAASYSALRESPHKTFSSSAPASSFTNLLRSLALISHHQQSPVSSAIRQSHLSSNDPFLNPPIRAEFFFKIPRTSNETTPTRPRSRTNEDRLLQASQPLGKSSPGRTSSVPENLNDWEANVQHSSTNPFMHGSPGIEGNELATLSHSFSKEAIPDGQF